jgi:hypothetical protein
MEDFEHMLEPIGMRLQELNSSPEQVAESIEDPS